MQRILYISWTDKMSGGEISVINYIKALRKQNEEHFSPIVICPQEGKLSQKLRKENIPFSILSVSSFSFKKPWRFFLALEKLVSLIKREKITHIHNTSFYSNQLAVIAGKICNIPVVTHGQSFVTSKEIKRNLLSYADKLIVCSDAVKRNLLPYVNED
ncbi:MAG: glycosyltransferase family 4 protein, partial [Nanoarchaeota archaeon]